MAADPDDTTPPDCGSADCAPPAAPDSLAATRLPQPVVLDLVRRHLFLAGVLLGDEIAAAVGLPLTVIAPSLRRLLDEGDLLARDRGTTEAGGFAFRLTESGRAAARLSFRSCRYVGPAPVMPDELTRRMQRQTLRRAWADRVPPTVGDDPLRDRIGAAVVDGHSLLIAGASGDGKTELAEHVAAAVVAQAGGIWVPHAVQVGSQTLTFFDATVHTPRPEPTTDWPIDRRWRLVSRPVVDLRVAHVGSPSRRSVDPIEKAAGGVLLLDDVTAGDGPVCRRLLKASEGVDRDPAAMLLLTGTDAAVASLDESVRRRIRHTIRVHPPSRETFAARLREECDRRNVPYEPAAFAALWQQCFVGKKASQPRLSDAAELIEIAAAICRFRRQPTAIGERVLLDAARQYLRAA